MATWDEFAAAAPELAAAVRARFDSHKHKMMATLRRDGSPRISGVETTFHDGELWLGMMDGSRKALDLRRDPRVAIHSASLDPEMSDGDAKVAGRAVEIQDEMTKQDFMRAAQEESGEQAPPEPYHLFRIDLTEAVLTRVGTPADHLVIDSWHEGTGLRQVKRR
jgi:general stress protein 26